MNVRAEKEQRFSIPGACSAVLMCGHRTAVSGDAVMVDSDFGIYAVCDSPDRCPEAAGNFLDNFKNIITHNAPLLAAEGHIKNWFESLIKLTETLIAGQDFHNNTTFSAIVLKENNAAVLHCGDSLIFRLRHRNGNLTEVVQLSRTNHLLVGRITHLYQKEMIKLFTGDSILLATDGLTELARSRGQSPVELIQQHAREENPDRCIDSLTALHSDSPVPLDDLGTVIIKFNSGRLLADMPGGYIILRQ